MAGWQAMVMTGDGSISEARAASCDDLANRRIQEIASEVLRLRLVQSQQKQLEAQLRAATDRLQRLPGEKVLQLSCYLEQGLRPGGSVGTLGGAHGGVDPENLYGLMECICVVCEARMASRRQEDLLAATRLLLQDPQALIEQLVGLPAASGTVSRRLAPFLLNCDSSWRGQLTEAGQCYETIRSWLSCYYQFSLTSGQMEHTSTQLQQQERLLEELTRDTDGSTGGIGGGNCLSRGSAWRQPSGVRRSSSVQSNSSTGSRRSHSPATDRAAAIGLRPSPRLGGAGAGARGRLSCAKPREGPATSPPKTNGHRAVERPAAAKSSGVLYSAPPPRTMLAAGMPARSNSPMQQRSGQALQPSSSRTSLVRPGDKMVEPSPRASAPRASAAAATTSSGAPSAPGSARSPGRQLSVPGGGGHPTPRHLGHSPAAEPSRPQTAARRQVTSTARARRSPSRDASAAAGVAAAPMASARSNASPRPGAGQQELSRSRSLQSITEPPGEVGATGASPPLMSREARQEKPAEAHSARLRGVQAAAPACAGARTARVPVASAASQAVAQPVLSARVARLSSGHVGSAAVPSHGTLSVRVRGQQPCPALALSSARRLAPSDSAAALRQPDAGSGGTCGPPPVAGDGALGGAGGCGSLAMSWSTPQLEMHKVPGCHHGGRDLLQASLRETPTQTPRPTASARSRPAA